MQKEKYYTAGKLGQRAEVGYVHIVGKEKNLQVPNLVLIPPNYKSAGRQWINQARLKIVCVM